MCATRFHASFYLFRCVLDMSMSTSNASSHSKHFTIKAFRFFRFLDGYNTVYLHCELMACHVNTANSRCSLGCERNRRKKRGARDSESPQSESSKKYALSAGPIMNMKSSKPTDNSKSGGTYFNRKSVQRQTDRQTDRQT